MYQLSHMLTDQKGIMNTLMELSLTGDNGKSLSTLMELSLTGDYGKSLSTLMELSLTGDNGKSKHPHGAVPHR